MSSSVNKNLLSQNMSQDMLTSQAGLSVPGGDGNGKLEESKLSQRRDQGVRVISDYEKHAGWIENVNAEKRHNIM